jgi:hypothetical protein
MSLTSASALNYLQWSQQSVNPPFAPSTQSDTSTFNTAFTIEATGVNNIYADEIVLTPLQSITIDLQDLLDFFNQTLAFTRVYTLQVQSDGADVQFGPGAVDPCVWFFGSATDRIVVKSGSNLLYNSQYPFPVESVASTLDFYNSSTTDSTILKIVIIGGTGAGTTSTTTTTATTVSSSTTPAVTTSSTTSPTVTSSTTTT